MELEKQYCIYCKRELSKNKRRKNQWHVKCHQSIYGKSSDIIFKGEIIYKKDYSVLQELDKEIKDQSSRYRLIKLTNLIHMFENFSYVISNKAVIGLDLKFQVQSIFYDLKHLETLYVTQFNDIRAEIAQLKNLRKLIIKHSGILKLPREIGKLTKLEYLEISGISGLTKLPTSIGNLKNLKTLKIAPINEVVKIQELPVTISQLQNLEFFYISGTNVTKLPKGFAQLKNLQELYILSRSLTELIPLTNFKQLRVFECQAKVTDLPESFSDLEGLEEVKIYNNSVTEIPSVLNFTKLKKFEIYNTLINRLPSGLSQIPHLKVLIIKQNPVKVLPVALSKLSELEIFDASQTNLTKLPEEFTFPELKKLNLEKTFITQLPQDIFLPKLEELRISCFMTGISKFISLKQVYIVNTLPGKELDSFPEELFNLNNLLSLDIGKANFTSIEDKFELLSKLRHLYIHKTKIRSMTGIPNSLREKIQSRNMVIYVHPEFDKQVVENTKNLKIKI